MVTKEALATAFTCTIAASSSHAAFIFCGPQDNPVHQITMDAVKKNYEESVGAKKTEISICVLEDKKLGIAVITTQPDGTMCIMAQKNPLDIKPKEPRLK